MEGLKNERDVPHWEIAQRLCIDERQVDYIIEKYGHDKIVDLLEIRGYYVWHELVNEYEKFRELVE